MSSSPPKLSMAQVLICGAAVVTLSMGIRHGFGLWLAPITQDMGWTRQTFSLAIAIQNLAWGVFGIFGGMAADRFGAFRVLIIGAVLYSLGLVGMALSPTPLLFALTTGVLIGAAQACTTYAVIYGVLGRQLPAEKRSWAMGVAGAAGSFGQFLMLPLEGQLLVQLGWQNTLLMLAAMVLIIVPLAFGLREPDFHAQQPTQHRQSAGQAFAEAMRHPSYWLLTSSYFVCGFQVVFIGVHMPSYLRDHGMQPQVASFALALIGLFNVFGTYAAGALGERFGKRHILAFIYFARSLFIAVFLWAPLSPLSVYIFSAAIGLLWLSTVPPTNAAVAHIFGVRHLSMLSGFAFFSHQIGSFLGVWLGGYMYDSSGSYDLVWYLAIAFGLLAGLLCLPVREHSLARPTTQGAQ